MGISSILRTIKLTYLSCFALLLLLPSWLLPSPSPLDPQLMEHQPHTMPQHPTMLPPTTMSPQSLMLSNTVLPILTPVLNLMLKKLLMAKLSLDLTKLLFPMAVSKPSPTPLITTMVMSLMSNTKVSPSTLRPSLTTPPPSPDITLKKLSKTEVANNYL